MNDSLKSTMATIGIALLAVLVVAVGIYLGTTLHPSKKGVTNIRWVVDPSPIREETIALFEKSHPGIEVTNDIDSGLQRLLTQLAGDVPPDVMAAYDAESLYTFFKYGLLLDLTPYIKKYNIPVDKFYPELHDYMYCRERDKQGNPIGEEKLVGIPENVCSLNLFYNKTVFDEHNRTAAPGDRVEYPTSDCTWDDMFAAADKLTKYKEVNGRKIAIQKGLYVMETPFIFVWMYGGHVYSPDGQTCVINEEAAKKGMRYWETLRMKAKVIPSASEAASLDSSGGWGGEQLLFAKGKVAMLITGRYMVTAFRQNYKNLDFGIARFPKAPCPNNLLLSKSYCIPATSKNRDQAIKFIVHLTSTANQNLVADYGDGVPSMNTPEIIQNFLYNPDYPKETENQNVLDDLAGAKPQERSLYISSTDFNQIWGLEVGKVWLGQQDMDTACDKIAKRVNEIIHRNMNNPNFVN